MSVTKYNICYLVIALMTLPGPACTNSDNLALLVGTLKTMQRAACDDEMVSLNCQRGTSISIQVAQYGKVTSEGNLCMRDYASDFDEDKCLWPNSMQYSLLQTVVEACQKKPQCKFSTKPKAGSVDPCPKTRKFVEVAYKCKPNEFRSRTGCENEVIKLSCSAHSRVVILEAQYGRRAHESLTCPQIPGKKEENCLAPHAAETVMQICHGRRRCQIQINTQTFGSNCKNTTRPYLKVVYACVPMGVLIERYEVAAEKDEVLNPLVDLVKNNELFDEIEDTGEKWGEPSFGVTLVLNPFTEVDTLPPLDKDIVINSKVADDNTKETKPTKMYLLIYILIAVIVIIIVIILTIVYFCYKRKKAAENSKNGNMFTTEAPNVFNDAVSDIDNDIDVSHISGTFYDPIHPDMLLYRDVPGNKGTLRAMRPLTTIYPCSSNMYGNADIISPKSRENRYSVRGNDIDIDGMTSPKSLGKLTNSQFLYG